jgi:cytochrome c-type biogenesis protein CcmH
MAQVPSSGLQPPSPTFLGAGVSKVASKGPHQPFGQLLQRRSDSLNDLPQCLQNLEKQSISQSESLPLWGRCRANARRMRSLWQLYVTAPLLGERRCPTGFRNRRRLLGMRAFVCIVWFLSFLCLPALAVQPDEILKDPVLEARARSISAGLRCLVCQNQSIDDSDAPVAKDLRILIREQLQQNRTDQDVVEFIVARYGEFVLLKPRLKPDTLILWAAPFVLLAAGLAFAFRRKPVASPDSLTTAEKAEVAAILRK